MYGSSSVRWTSRYGFFIVSSLHSSYVSSVSIVPRTTIVPVKKKDSWFAIVKEEESLFKVQMIDNASAIVSAAPRTKDPNWEPELFPSSCFVARLTLISRPMRLAVSSFSLPSPLSSPTDSRMMRIGTGDLF